LFLFLEKYPFVLVKNILILFNRLLFICTVLHKPSPRKLIRKLNIQTFQKNHFPKITKTDLF